VTGWLVLITENESVYCAVETEYLNGVQFVFLLCKSVFENSQKMNYLHPRERVQGKAKKYLKGKSTK